MKKLQTKGSWAVMLCGGLGSRMGSLTAEKPKSLLMVYGKPIIWYSFWTLYKHGCRNFILPLGYLGKMIQKYIHQITSEVQCNIYTIDTGLESSIANRIKQVKHLIPENKDFLLLNTDTLFDFDIKAMNKVHVMRKSLVTLSSVEVISPWGVLTISGEDIINFDRNRKVQKLISNHTEEAYGVVNSGIAWINKNALKMVDFENENDFETELFGAAIKAKKISHFKIDGIWYPIDTPKDLNSINYAFNSNEKPKEILLSALSTISNSNLKNQNNRLRL
tara:strand:+ start:81 stop:911 length:831 start_codon:yes stop_codon:yes gene_type:complete